MFCVSTENKMLGLYYRRPATTSFYRRSEPKPIIRDSLQKNNLTKNGHMFKKTFQEGDDKLLLEPHRDYSGIFLYKKYKHYTHDNSALLSACSCNHAGYMCDHCEVLNTSVFHNMEVPLNPEDFEKLKDFCLKQQKWSEKNLYDWLAFWVRALKQRHSGYKRELVFLNYRKFLYMGTHSFFYYLFEFVTSGKVLKKDPEGRGPLPIDMNGGAIRRQHKPEKTQPNKLAIKTGDAMIRLSFQIYGKSGRVVSIHSDFRKSIITFSYEKDTRQDIFSIQQTLMKFHEKWRWKRVFQYSLETIENEVRFRPGMCGMEECMISFQKNLELYA